MQVKLLSYTPEPLKALATATLTSYWDEWSLSTIKNIGDKDAEMHIPKVLESGHESVLEHITLTFAVEGISIVTLKQITRHRHMSFTVRSQRYIEMDVDEGWVVPPTVRELGWENIYDEYIKDLFVLYDRMVHDGVPPEDARYILPQAITTKFTVTMNMREFKHFISLRMCERAQWEIRELATIMWAEVIKVPELKRIVLWAKIAPRCINLGYCPERNLMPPGCFKSKKEWWKVVSSADNT